MADRGIAYLVTWVARIRGPWHFEMKRTVPYSPLVLDLMGLQVQVGVV